MSTAAQHLADQVAQTHPTGILAAARRHWREAQSQRKTADRMKGDRAERYLEHAKANLLLAAVLEEAQRTTPRPTSTWVDRAWARHREQFDRDPGDFAVMLHRRLESAR